MAAAVACALWSLSLVDSASGVAGFSDVGSDQYYTEAVQWMVDRGITVGVSPGCFAPEAPVTRGQAAAFIWRMEGEPRPASPHGFGDVVEPWQHDAVSWMSQAGITTGTSPTTYEPSRAVTRGELAVLIWRLAGEPRARAHPFVDVVAPWQQDAVSWMSRRGITTGTSPTTFSPERTVTRGQLATFFHRYKGAPSVNVDTDHPVQSRCASPLSNPGGDGQVRLGVSSPHVNGTTVSSRIAGLERELGAGHLGAVRLYHAWDEWFPQASEDFLTDPSRDTVPILSVGTHRSNGQRVPWHAVADAQPGSQLHQEMARWADDLRRFGRPIVVTLDHEPDHYRNGGTGQPHDYRRAHQRFVSILRNRGADNVQVGFVGVAWNFDPRSTTDVGDYYPGDAWVDIIGVDGYNWGSCTNPSGEWRTFDQVFAPFLSWAASHPGKPLMIAEFGVAEDHANPGWRKAGWLSEVSSALADPKWNRLDYAVAWDNLWEVDNNCDFRVSQSSTVRTAFRDLMQNPIFG